MEGGNQGRTVLARHALHNPTAQDRQFVEEDRQQVAPGRTKLACPAALVASGGGRAG